MTEEQIKIENEKRLELLENKFEEIKERQESELTYDFDKALEEYVKKKERFTVRFLGKIYELPQSVPFNFSTFFLRYCVKKVGGQQIVSIPDDKILQFIKLMFGQKFLVALETSNDVNVSIEFVNETIVPLVMKQWGYDIDNENVKDLQKKISSQGL